MRWPRWWARRRSYRTVVGGQARSPAGPGPELGAWEAVRTHHVAARWDEDRWVRSGIVDPDGLQWRLLQAYHQRRKRVTPREVPAGIDLEVGPRV